jgi:hypothetical protein
MMVPGPHDTAITRGGTGLLARSRAVSGPPGKDGVNSTWKSEKGEISGGSDNPLRSSGAYQLTLM